MGGQALGLPEAELGDLCRRYGVRELSLFGSSARGELREDSDLDLLVDFLPGREVGFLTLARMQRELAEVLERPVDLVPKRGLHRAIAEEVLAEAKVVYAS